MLRKEMARRGGGQGGRPFLLLSSPQAEPSSAAPPQPAGGRPQAKTRTPGDRRLEPRARWLNPREPREGTFPSYGGLLLLGISGKGPTAFVLRGLGEAALQRSSAGGAGAPGLLTFARGVSKITSFCLLGKGVQSWGEGVVRGKGELGEGFCVSARLFVCIGGGERGLKVDSSRVLRMGQIPEYVTMLHPRSTHMHTHAHTRTRTDRQPAGSRQRCSRRPGLQQLRLPAAPPRCVQRGSGKRLEALAERRFHEE